ncbi:ribokinase [Clostridium uliginosum]|uniref:Ribokinase n=1 Tax=Clostridium uliginosum TaxID=119641 RepID=A0A1I1S0G5_9CLOT|nr:ribokinase [Clostridium uliginosum]SFD37273.1 ribokinase [Clostridium uliginosum]
MKNVIVLGSLNMDLSIQCEDLPKSGETINGFDFFVNPGGKGGNQAVACAKLGTNTNMIANIGNDVFGNEILEALKKYKVNIENIQISKEDSTGIAMVIRSHNDNRIILGNGANHTLNLEFVKKKLKKISKPGDIFLTQLENEFTLVNEGIVYAKELGLYTILNPAPARTLNDEIYKNLDLVVVNQSECQELTGIFPNDEETSLEALKVFEKKQVKAIITLGMQGSITNYDNEPIFVPIKKVDTVDTTSAGDAYIGAICSCLAEGTNMKYALEFATKIAAITVTRRGAQVSIPYKEEVKNYFKED